jgi:BolA protein
MATPIGVIGAAAVQDPVITRESGSVAGIGQNTDNRGMTIPLARADRIRAALSKTFAPALLQVRDDSAQHAGHAGARAGGETHYSVLMVAASFQGLTRVARSRAVHAALAAEFGDADAGGMHALALTLRTPDEQAALTSG